MFPTSHPKLATPVSNANRLAREEYFGVKAFAIPDHDVVGCGPSTGCNLHVSCRRKNCVGCCKSPYYPSRWPARMWHSRSLGFRLILIALRIMLLPLLVISLDDIVVRFPEELFLVVGMAAVVADVLLLMRVAYHTGRERIEHFVIIDGLKVLAKGGGLVSEILLANESWMERKARGAVVIVGIGLVFAISDRRNCDLEFSVAEYCGSWKVWPLSACLVLVELDVALFAFRFSYLPFGLEVALGFSREVLPLLMARQYLASAVSATSWWLVTDASVKSTPT